MSAIIIYKIYSVSLALHSKTIYSLLCL